jgi:hypothetical protein
MEAALEELSASLEQRGIQARIYLVGGAAMVLAFDARLSTDDLDAAVYPVDEVMAVAREVAARRGLDEGWLNDSAKFFLPVVKEHEWRSVLKVGKIDVVAADERTMLAMKLRASRGARDQDDIEFLLRKCGIEDEVAARALYDEYFPEDPLPQRALPMLRHAVASIKAGESGEAPLAAPGS